jgi:large subunit ribosomal protein L15
VNIQELPGDRGRRQRRKLLGRGHGSGKGQTSGRGNKGFQARSGSDTRSGGEGGQMPLIRRLPKRGFHPLDKVRYNPVNVGQLERFDAGAEVGPEALQAARLVHGKTAPIKILATGELNKPLRVRAHAFSEAARQKILQAGGSCEPIESRRTQGRS